VVLDAHRPLDLDNVSEGNGEVLVLRDSREQVPCADGSGAEAFPHATDGASGSERDDDGGSGAEEERNEAGEGASSPAFVFNKPRETDRKALGAAIGARSLANLGGIADTRISPRADAAGRRVRRRMEAAERRVQVRQKRKSASSLGF